MPVDVDFLTVYIIIKKREKKGSVVCSKSTGYGKLRVKKNVKATGFEVFFF